MVNKSFYTNGDESDSAMAIKSSSKSFPVAAKRYHLTAWFIFMVVVTFILIIYTEPELSDAEHHLITRMGELHVKEKYLDYQYHSLEEQTTNMLSKLNYILTTNPNITTAQIQNMLKNITDEYSQSKFSLKPPSIFDFLPHLSINFSSLQPFYRISKGRQGVTTVLGIPTVRRSAQSYLLSTLNDLIYKMSVNERNDTLIVVLIAETDETYVTQVANEILSQFKEEIESGLIDIISPPSSFYPDFDKLPTTLSDPMERVRWRSKQSLDFAFLMMYAYRKGMFYVQLEDDILAKKNYLSIMKEVAFSKIATKQPWFVLDFCQLGFIGKMFRCVDLPWVIQFFLMFFNDKPVDWLLDGLIQTKVCSLEKDNKDCKRQKERLWVHNKPSLFQHIGTTSSLKGKVQKLKDKHFGKVALFYPHLNPSARVLSSISVYKRHTLKRAYDGETFFWGLMPRANDWISFEFHQPVYIKRFKFKSGNAESPSDKLYNTSVLAWFDSATTSSPLPFLKSKYHYQKNDSYVVVGSFDSLGVAVGNLGKRLGAVKELRLVIHNDSQNWVILSEIMIEIDTSKR
ncbi:alpha-1,3-mannosyl-glycoprotein 4-beta-N-acetylglucosaminyltransferase B-like [Planococcus citri]|uniref:alpha-1,3-mannosyl-glycoprotein 4-beta-N-acetylglucosaminyltransferase B-like n=1 Tax=Planococcus citri TaxID=170843 RepID=UPI0031FA1684